MRISLELPPISKLSKIAGVLIACAIGLLVTINSWGFIEKSDYWGFLSKTCSNFFVQCDSKGCGAIGLPFLGYLLNLSNSTKSLTLLWLFVLYILAIYYYYQLILSESINSIQLLMLLPIFTLCTLSTQSIYYSPSLICATLCVAISGIKSNNYQYASRFFAVASILFDPLFALTIYLSFIVISLSLSSSKKVRISVISMSYSVFLGSLILGIYLFLVNINFTQIDLIFNNSLKGINIIIFFNTLFALFFVNAKKSTK
jgi:hypothetical protein